MSDPAAAATAATRAWPRSFRLPAGMQIGTATAAIQVEGGDRGNQWWAFAQQAGRIADASTPEVATGHWQRWPEDVALMADLGFRIHRMGLEWSRLEPEPDQWDHAAAEHYRAELVALRERGITPLVTLHHFSHPLWFDAMGGWEADEAVYLFLRHVRRVVEAFGDLVTEWCTINEPNVVATGGYVFGIFPPGRKNAFAAAQLVMRRMAVAHCRAYHLIHDIQGQTAKVGFAHHLRVFAPLNSRNPVHRTVARSNEYLFQGALTDAMLGGRFAKALGGQPESVTPGPHYDYLGINYYSRSAVSKVADGTFPGVPVNDLGWEIYPEGLVEVARRLHAAYPGPIWVTENGTCDNNERFRSRFLRDHLAAIAGSRLPFERYYHWCFVDNWEWAEGFVPRFGIVAQDGPGGERTVKPSGRFLAAVAASGEVTEDLVAQYVDGQVYP